MCSVILVLRKKLKTRRVNGDNGVGYNRSEADNMNQKEVPTDLISESLDRRLSL